MSGRPEKHSDLHRLRYRKDALRYAGLALGVNTVMALFKAAVGAATGSHALLASALYSVNDLLSSIALAVSLKVGFRKPSEEHPYGYGNAEFIAVGIVSLALVIGVLVMFSLSVIDILRGVPGPPHTAALSLAALSLVVSWQLSRRAHVLAEALDSPALATSSDHHHADVEGSVAAIVGVGGAVLGFHVLDRIAAVFETLHLIALSGTLLARAVRGLMDASLPEEDTSLISRACARVQGVQHVEHVWSRKLGSDAWVDVTVAVDEQLDVRRAHQVSRQVAAAVHSVVGRGVTTQVRFQSPNMPEHLPGPGGSGHG